MRYIEVNLSFNTPSQWNDIFIAFLSDLGYDSFHETDDGLRAYIKSDNFSVEQIDDILKNIQTDVSYSYKLLENINWNAKWESDFKPVIIDKSCGIRASFHDPLEVEYEIVITPKMSFGTGHHATTSGMMRAMMNINFSKKNVLDMGCGTSVLAILASKLGANHVTAIDIDEWAFTNSKENLLLNHIKNVDVKQGASNLISGPYDVILANINRNVLIEDMFVYAKALSEDGILLLSGFYTHDLDIINQKANENMLKLESHASHDNWVTAKFLKRI